jgi:hypothetical protein
MGLFIGVFAFMLLPVWIPLITAIVGAVYDLVKGAGKAVTPGTARHESPSYAASSASA